jgi:hypothetical protein
MKSSEVKIGQTYVVKVSGQLRPVTILQESSYGGWDAFNDATGRRVHIRSPRRLRAVCDSPELRAVLER